MPRNDFALNTDRHDRIPSYRLHKASGQAIVTLAGRDVYLGDYGSRESRNEYRRRISEFLGGGRIAPAEKPDQLVTRLVVAYWKSLQGQCQSRTLEATVKPALRRLRSLYGNTLAVEFGPLKLKAFARELITERDAGGRRLSRPYVNRSIREIRRLFKWAVSEEVVPASVYHGLLSVDGLRYGKTDAPEPEPVRPVPDAFINQTLPHLPAVVADMVRVQRLTGMRPGELCRMTGREIDTTSRVWIYAPGEHKTKHFGKRRIVPIGPRAQEVLRPYLRTDIAAPLFSPAESERNRWAAQREDNQTPFTPSRLKRDAKRARKPRRVLNDCYTPTTYARAVRRGCEKAEIEVWTPNQLRHSKATELRKEFGLDAAGAVLGHSRLETTQIYAERSEELAMNAALKTG